MATFHQRFNREFARTDPRSKEIAISEKGCFNSPLWLGWLEHPEWLVGHPSITEKNGWRVTQSIRQDVERNRIISRMTRSP
jgi:hypothetical protein